MTDQNINIITCRFEYYVKTLYLFVELCVCYIHIQLLLHISFICAQITRIAKLFLIRKVFLN